MPPRIHAFLFTRPIAWVLVATWVALGATPRVAAAGQIASDASCGVNGSISFEWEFRDSAINPILRPDWVGYDVLRRTMGACNGFVRLNETSYPRSFGPVDHYTYVDASVSHGTMYEYTVVPVDANRQQLYLGDAACDPCDRVDWTSCPEGSAALTHGTLYDMGWAMVVEPCPEGCYGGFYVADDAWVDALRKQVGPGEAVRFYARPECGSTEGCWMVVDHFEIAPCGATPALRGSWGRVKTIYR